MSKSSVFPNEKHIFPKFIDKFLKFEEVDYLIHHVKFEIWSVLCTFPISFSTVKFKLEQNVSQFIYRFKIGTFKLWSQTKFLSGSQFTIRMKIVIFGY